MEEFFFLEVGFFFFWRARVEVEFFLLLLLSSFNLTKSIHHPTNPLIHSTAASGTSTSTRTARKEATAPPPPPREAPTERPSAR